MAASDERTAAKNTSPFLSEANSMHRAKPVFGFACFDFVFYISLIFLKCEVVKLASSNLTTSFYQSLKQPAAPSICSKGKNSPKIPVS